MLEKLKKPQVISLIIFSIGLIVFVTVAIFKLRPQSSDESKQVEQELELSADEKQNEVEQPKTTIAERPITSPTNKPTIAKATPTTVPTNTPIPTEAPSSTPSPQPTNTPSPTSNPTSTPTSSPTPTEAPTPTEES